MSNSDKDEFSIRRPVPLEPQSPAYATRGPSGVVLHVAGRRYDITPELARRLARELIDAAQPSRS